MKQSGQEKVFNATQYSKFLGFKCIQSFSSNRKRHPERFAPSFQVGRYERWFLSTIIAFHKSMESRSPGDSEASRESVN